jgi:hypothetical protein
VGQWQYLGYDLNKGGQGVDGIEYTAEEEHLCDRQREIVEEEVVTGGVDLCD